MRRPVVAALLTAASLFLAACDNDKTEQKTEAQTTKIVIGLDDNFPPMGFRSDEGELVGFDIDMAREAAKRMGVIAEFKPIDWNAKEAELIGKRVDMLWNGLTITEARKKVIAFSAPYMENRQIIIIKSDSLLRDKGDLAGKIIGLQDGSSAIEAVESDPETLETLAEIRKYGDNVTALMDLMVGRTDAVVVDEVVGRFYVSKKPDDYLILNDHFGSEEYGVGLRQEDTELLAKLQAALEAMKADGTSATIAKKWFGENIIK